MIDIRIPTSFHTTMNRPSLEKKTSAEMNVIRMSHGINLDPTPAPDAEIIQLKRTQNSLLKIARIPPEILGHIFHLYIAGVGGRDFSKIPKGSYDFLLVCHHWSQVALRTPGLWTSWGSRIEEWKRRCLRFGISSLDLILAGWSECEDFDEALRDALRDRAARDVIRKVHLRSSDVELLTAIISSLIPEGEDIRPSSIESIALSRVDVSDLFARYHFPKLRNLQLSGNFKISSWDYLKSTTTALTRLSLEFNATVPPSAVPTTSQILSLLASNPNLRSLTLYTQLINDDGGAGPRLQVPLHHLEYIYLPGTFQHVFPILHRLEFPERMDHGEIALQDCTPQEVLEVIGPYIRDYLRRDPRFRDRLGLFVSSTPSYIKFRSNVGVQHDGSNRRPRYGPIYGSFLVSFSQPIHRLAANRLCTDVLALLSQESITSFETDFSLTEEILVAMPNLRALYLLSPVVSDRFLLPDPDGPNAHKKLLPSLQLLHLEDAEAVDNNWEPLVTYLAYQTSGGQAVSLYLSRDHVCLEVIERIKGLVEEFVYGPDREQECPFDSCPLAG